MSVRKRTSKKTDCCEPKEKQKKRKTNNKSESISSSSSSTFKIFPDGYNPPTVDFFHPSEPISETENGTEPEPEPDPNSTMVSIPLTTPIQTSNISIRKIDTIESKEKGKQTKKEKEKEKKDLLQKEKEEKILFQNCYRSRSQWLIRKAKELAEIPGAEVLVLTKFKGLQDGYKYYTPMYQNYGPPIQPMTYQQPSSPYYPSYYRTYYPQTYGPVPTTHSTPYTQPTSYICLVGPDCQTCREYNSKPTVVDTTVQKISYPPRSHPPSYTPMSYRS